MRLAINLATRIYINKRRVNLFIACALALLILIMMLNARNIAAGLGEMGRLEKGIAKLEGKSRSAKDSAVPEKEYKTLIGRIKFANGVIERKSFDWLMLLDRLENVVPERVGIASIVPSAKDMELKLSGVALKFDDLRKFIENLEASEFFTDVYLISQTDIKGKEGEQGINFDITCKAKYR